jgi:hypothetical protein
MRPILSASLMAIVAAVSISACSSSSNSSNASTDTNSATSAAADNSATSSAADNSAAAPADAGAAAAPADVAVYPGATEGTPPGASGTPPPGVKGYSTPDGAAKVMAWYKDNLKGAKAVTSSADGGIFMVGDTKTGTAIMIQSMGGKTWIVSGPAASMAH